MLDMLVKGFASGGGDGDMACLIPMVRVLSHASSNITTRPWYHHSREP